MDYTKTEYKPSEKPGVYYFQTEVNQLLSLIVNTFYRKKEIFLRELISNASDALDKVRFKSIGEPSILDSEPDLYIHVIPCRANNTLTIADSGIGMTKNDLINNIGTIARSGTKKFVEALKQGTDISLIGQFGVGFYASYLVSKKVIIYTKSNMDNYYSWESLAGCSFSISKIEPVSNFGRGTRVVLYLKDDQLEFLEERRLKEIIKKHSEFISYPIALEVERTIEKDLIKDNQEDGKTNQNTEKIKEIRKELQVLNKQKPIWMKRIQDISEEEYSSFYKAITNDWEDHLAKKHFSVEGQVDFKSIIFVPRRAPFDLFDSRKKTNNIKLYVRRVFIMDNCYDIIPDYLNFIKGIVDSEDLPLNISREALQQNKILKVIKKNLVKKCIEMFFEIAQDSEDYNKFYEAFSKNLKLGVHEDSQNRSKLAELLRFRSSKVDEEVVTFKEYISRCSEKQKKIYYITGENIEQLKKSPFIEKLLHYNIEVLFMVDPMDEYCMQQLKEFEGYKLICVTKEGLTLDDIDPELQKKHDELVASFSDLCEVMKEILGDQVEKVIVSDRIQKSPGCLVTGEYGWTANMERIMKAQALRDPSMSSYMASKKTYEINPHNKIIIELKRRVELDRTDRMIRDLTYLLFDVTLIVSGFAIENPTNFSERVSRILELGLNLTSEDVDAQDNNSLNNNNWIANDPSLEKID
mmetsp:Transcript_15174/g.21278  ORF Transcript_15174/g.21278 Transcript_15174/m.21278 type:complete len:694 (+) Transcript_15174:3351-5432(+)